MSRKKWEAKVAITSTLLKLREKRKWQIALRRYVLDNAPCVEYAPYFALDNERMRNWFEMQFQANLHWNNFGKKWQFEHIVPVSFFDFSIHEELKLAWNFTNLKVVELFEIKQASHQFNSFIAQKYFENLLNTTQYFICKEMVEKIKQINQQNQIDSTLQESFIQKEWEFLQNTGSFDSIEFEMLNQGKTMDEIKKESEILKKFGS